MGKAALMKAYGRAFVWASALLLLVGGAYYDLARHIFNPPLSSYYYISIGCILMGETKTGDFIMAFIKENGMNLLKKKD